MAFKNQVSYLIFCSCAFGHDFNVAPPPIVDISMETLRDPVTVSPVAPNSTHRIGASINETRHPGDTDSGSRHNSLTDFAHLSDVLIHYPISFDREYPKLSAV